MDRFRLTCSTLIFSLFVVACGELKNFPQPIKTPTNALISPTTSSVSNITITSTATTTLNTSTLVQDTPFPSTETPTMQISATPTVSQFLMCSPLGEETIASLWEIITDPYNPPPAGSDERHQGVDFSYYRRGNRLTIEGELVQSILPGKVAASIQDRLPYGNMVIIETSWDILPGSIIDAIGIHAGESLYSLYAHMQAAPSILLGEFVQCGQILGTVGTTGYNVVNPHLHLETRIGLIGIEFDRMAFYDTSASLEEMDNYLRWRTSGEFRHFDPMVLFNAYLDYLMTTDRDPYP
jgi:murein DD-endopeptidase MepM/ murein hydrolase activator NlpD